VSQASPPEPTVIISPRGGVIVSISRHARAEAVTITRGRVAARGTLREMRQRFPAADVLRPDGTGLPGFRDAHVHLMGLAASLAAADCSPAVVPDIAGLIERIRGAVPTESGWVHAFGYDHRILREGRHPTRWDLDEARTDRPVILKHRSGHAVVLNSAALSLLGLEKDPHLSGGRVLLDERGRPNGVLIDGDRDLRARGIPRRRPSALASRVDDASLRLARAGVTWFCDASPDNDDSAQSILTRFDEGGLINQRWSMLQGIDSFNAVGPGDFAGVKLVVETTTEEVQPGPEDLAHTIARIDKSGSIAAVHAADLESLIIVVEAFERTGGGSRLKGGHRVEHAPICPPFLAQRLRRLGIAVVPQPAFLHAFGDAYLDRVLGLPEWLLPVGDLHSTGVHLAFGSDSPAGPIEPLRAVATAVARTTASGTRVPGKKMPVEAALVACTERASPWGGGAGNLDVGEPGDMVVFSHDPLSDEPVAEDAAFVYSRGRVIVS
jgi:predicted amidohydrolase YtcJ